MIKRLLKANLIYTSVGPPIEHGMIAIDENNLIVAVGKNLSAQGVTVEYFPAALCPAFINTHCHLELSQLEGKITPHKGLDGFIDELQKSRNHNIERQSMAIEKADEAMRKAGIAAVGDICNHEISFEMKASSKLHYHSFIELFALDPKQAKNVFEKGLLLAERLRALNLPFSIVPHSPYSVSQALLSQILTAKEQNRICMHNQETASENELFQSGSGKLADLFQKFGIKPEFFPLHKKNSLPALIAYFPPEIPLLLVHNTFTSIADLKLAEQIHSKLYWCFCPKANLYIENQLPNFPIFVSEGVKCTLGTDSLASNDSLSIFEEMKVIQKAQSDIPKELLIEWACINGAEFLGVEADLGSLEVGKKAKINCLTEDENGFWKEVKPIAL